MPPSTRYIITSLISENILRFTLITILYLGAFSRFTHGTYTPSFHAYQVDRAPDNEHTWMIPVADTILGTALLLFQRARCGAALLCALGQAGGIVKRVVEGKSLLADVGILMLALLVALTEWSGWHRGAILLGRVVDRENERPRRKEKGSKSKRR